MKGEKSSLTSARSGRDIILANDSVQIRLIYRDGGYSQEFFGIDNSGRPRMLLSTIHRNLIPFTEHRLTADPMFSGKRQHLFEVNRDSLRMIYSEAQVDKSENRLTATLSGNNSSGSFSTTITLTPGSKLIHVTVEAEPASSPRGAFFEYFMAAYAFLPDGMLLDNYTRPDYAWAPSLRPEDDHIICENSFKSPTVVVQRRKLLAAVIPDPACHTTLPLALDLDMRNGLISAPLLAYGLCGSERDGAFYYHDRSILLRPDEKRVSFSFYLYLDADARTTTGFEPVQEHIWSMARCMAKQSGTVSAQTEDGLPSAYALLAASPSQEDIQAAEKIIERALSGQTSEGPFAPANYDVPYDMVLDSETCRWLLMIHRLTGGDLRLLFACKTFGDFLLANQLPSGAIPSWFSHRLDPLSELSETAETAASGRFLVELYDATGERHYLDAAKRAGSFVMSLISKEHYIDRSLLSSNAAEIRDYHTMINSKSSIAIRHSADFMISLFRATKVQTYLKAGLIAISRMCWFQNTWSGIIGSFAVGNAVDGKPSGAAFGRTLLEYYSATNRIEYMERGIAAIHAGLALGDPDAAAIRQWAIRKFGSALIDVKNHSAHSFGLCSIHDLSVSPGSVAFTVRNGYGNGRHSPATIKFSGLRGNSYRITINGEGKRYSKVELETGISIALY